MKTALIRVLAIATLASSMSAFAATDEPKRGDAATASAAQQQDGCPENAGHGKRQRKVKSQRDDQKEKELDRLLMGMYG
jgi:serine/threonine protein kinase HipA of HipAB toxin-antitoxin module